MNYLLFHLIFIIPPILICFWLSRKSLNLASISSLLFISLIALIYTIPWDSHLISKEVWTYPTSAIIMTIGNIPLEEYFFMVLQPILTGLITLKFLSNQKINLINIKNYKANIVGFLFWMALSGLGFYLFKGIKTYYLGFILIWASPILALQWAYGGEVLWRLAKTHAIILLIVTSYLCIADKIAIQAGIWHIEERFSTEIFIFGLPIEELVFFGITNLLVIFGVSLFKFKLPNMNYSEKRLIEKLIIFPSWILLLTISISFLFGFSISPPSQLYIIFVLGILFGFPHGATDHLVPFEILKKKKLSLNMFWLLCAYIFFLGAYLWLWFFNSVIAIILFGLLTWIHWGQGELYALISFNEAEYTSDFGFLRKLLVIIVRGGIPLIIPILKQPLEMTDLISSIERAFPNQSNTEFLSNLTLNGSDLIHKIAIALILLTLLHILLGYFFSNTHKSKKIWALDLFEILILYFFFMTVTPIFAIGIYLFTWHSWRHLARLFLCDSKAMSAIQNNFFSGCIYFALKATPTSIIASMMVLVLYFLMPTENNDYMKNIVPYLVIISSLTLPHMIIVFWMDIQQGVWREKANLIKENFQGSLQKR